MDERQRDHLGEATGALLDPCDDLEMIGPGPGMVDVPEHDRRGRPQPQLVGSDHHLRPLRRPDLVRAEMGSHLVVEDLRGGPGKSPQTGRLELFEELTDRDTEGMRPLPDLERGEPVDVHVGKLRLDRSHHVDIEVAGEIGMDPSLEGDLGGAPRPGLAGIADYLLDTHQIGLATQVEALRPLGEGAEPAFEVAEVGVVDVSVDDIGDRVTHGTLPQPVGHESDCIDLVAASPEQSLDFGGSGADPLQRTLENRGEVACPRDPIRCDPGDPGSIGPLGGKPEDRDRRLEVLAGSPGVTGPGGAGAVDLAQPGGEDLGGELLSSLVDLDSEREGGALDEHAATQSLPQLTDPLHVPIAQKEVAGTEVDHPDRLHHVIDEHRYRSLDPGQSHQLGQLLDR